MNLTAGIYMIFRGLNFDSNEESGKKSRFRTDTSSGRVIFFARCKLKVMGKIGSFAALDGNEGRERHETDVHNLRTGGRGQ